MSTDQRNQEEPAGALASDGIMPEDGPTPSRRARRALIFLTVFVAAFIVAPLIKVAYFGGGNFYSRIGRWVALRVSIQSTDPGRIAVDDRDAEIEILTNFLYPFDTAAQRAADYYDLWRAQANWSIRKAELKKVEYSEDGRSAESTMFVHMQDVYDVREYQFVARWHKLDGVWYVEEEAEILLDEYTKMPPEVYIPDESKGNPLPVELEASPPDAANP